MEVVLDSEKTKVSMQIDLGVDLQHMYDMISSMHKEYTERHTQYEEMAEQISIQGERIRSLHERIQDLERENQQLHEYQETLLGLVWDVDVVWIEEWLLKSEANVIRLFCVEDTHSNTNRLGIVSRCGSFNNVVELWEFLARCCEEGEREANTNEIRALEVVLRLFNTSQRAKKAQLLIPGKGEECRASAHTKLRGEGDIISLVILPGLYNVQGEIKTKALVCTE